MLGGQAIANQESIVFNYNRRYHLGRKLAVYLGVIALVSPTARHGI